MPTRLIDADQVSPMQKARVDRYLASHCDSRCYNDGNCPHEAEILAIIEDETNHGHD